MSEHNKRVKSLEGKVISDKMDKSVSVLILRTVKHPLFDKYIKRSTKLLAHDEQNACQCGDLVVIEAVRPLSKRKSWSVQKIIRKALTV